VLGQFTATGVIPRLAEELREIGGDLPITLFQPATELSHE
jgi:hypothetical protein